MPVQPAHPGDPFISELIEYVENRPPANGPHRPATILCAKPRQYHPAVPATARSPEPCHVRLTQPDPGTPTAYLAFGPAPSTAKPGFCPVDPGHIAASLDPAGPATNDRRPARHPLQPAHRAGRRAAAPGDQPAPESPRQRSATEHGRPGNRHSQMVQYLQRLRLYFPRLRR
ncbi:hypothetical protein D9M68_876990 [compost metagenome]